MTATVLKFFRGKKGNVVARLPNGKIALISKNYQGTLPKHGERWVCRIDLEKQNFAVVTPIERATSVRIQVITKEYIEYKCGCKKLEREIKEEVTKYVGISEIDKVQKVEERVKVLKAPWTCEKHRGTIIYSCGHSVRSDTITGTVYKDHPCAECLRKTNEQKMEDYVRKANELIRQIKRKAIPIKIRAVKRVSSFVIFGDMEHCDTPKHTVVNVYTLLHPEDYKQKIVDRGLVSIDMDFKNALLPRGTWEDYILGNYMPEFEAWMSENLRILQKWVKGDVYRIEPVILSDEEEKRLNIYDKDTDELKKEGWILFTKEFFIPKEHYEAIESL